MTQMSISLCATITLGINILLTNALILIPELHLLSPITSLTEQIAHHPLIAQCGLYNCWVLLLIYFYKWEQKQFLWMYNLPSGCQSLLLEWLHDIFQYHNSELYNRCYMAGVTPSGWINNTTIERIKQCGSHCNYIVKWLLRMYILNSKSSSPNNNFWPIHLA